MNTDENISSRFIKPEKLEDLRTKREIELIHGRSWTRTLPPPPVLPPFGPLEKISGRLEAFSKEYFREYFNADAYRTFKQPTLSDSQRGAAAGAAILAGSPGVGAALMTKSDSEYDSAEYVQGIINGKPFRGWVGITRLQTGDDVEMVAEWQHDHYEVYAITLPEERIISLCPKCEFGHIAQAWLRIKYMFILVIILMSAFIIIFFIQDVQEVDFNINDFFSDNGGLLLFLFLINIFVNGAIAYSAYKAYFPTCCKLVEEIFSILGMENVAKINLRKITKKREKELIASGRWHDPKDQTKPVYPSAKFIYSDESWYYY